MKKQARRPTWVQKAVVHDDLETLRYAAKKSHEAQAKKKDERAEADQYYRERQIAKSDAEADQIAGVDREHIVPLEPNEEAA